jgi:hypothetical protein
MNKKSNITFKFYFGYVCWAGEQRLSEQENYSALRILE